MRLDVACCLETCYLVDPLVIRFHLMNVGERFSSQLFLLKVMLLIFVNIMYFLCFLIACIFTLLFLHWTFDVEAGCL